MDTGTCKSCGAAIIWATTRAGRRMPLDKEPDAGRGNVRLRSDGTADVLGGDALTEASDCEEELYTSHFATCPGAAGHRKPKGGA